MSDKTVWMTEADALNLSRDVLLKKGFSERVAQAIGEVVVAGQKSGCASHGLYRILGCIKTLELGGVVPDAEPSLESSSGNVIRVNANGGFSQLPFLLGLPRLVEKAKESGIALLAINHCVHFSALWVEVEQITSKGLVAIACNPTQAYVAPHGGSAPLLGTNPFAFGWPRPGKPPFVFDFATSRVARGDVELYAREGKPVPDGWGVDSTGKGSNDPLEVLEEGALLPFGEHKGAAISMMIELIAGPLIGDLMSFESTQHDAGKGTLPYHGEVVIAMDPGKIAGEGYEDHLSRAENFFDLIEAQGARMPSERRYENQKKSERYGIAVPENLHLELCSLLDD